MNKCSLIFYTDDDQDDQEFFVEVVSDVIPECIVRLQDSGDELLNTLNSEEIKPDVLFLDINMPGLSGFQVLERLRKTKDYHQTPVVMLSTTDDINLINKAKKAGANMFITKPGEYKMFCELVEVAIKRNCTDNTVLNSGFYLNQSV